MILIDSFNSFIVIRSFMLCRMKSKFKIFEKPGLSILFFFMELDMEVLYSKIRLRFGM